MNAADPTGIVAAGGVMLLLTVVLTVLIWQGFGLLRARAGLDREDEYRALAEQVAESQAKLAQELRTARVEVAELRERVFAMDALLREVG